MCSIPCCDQYCAHCSPCSAHLAELNTCCAQYFSELSTLLCSPCCAQYLAVLSTLLNSVPCCAHLAVNSNLLRSVPCCDQYIAVHIAHLAMLNTLLSLSLCAQYPCRAHLAELNTLLCSVPFWVEYLALLNFLCQVTWLRSVSCCAHTKVLRQPTWHTM